MNVATATGRSSDPDQPDVPVTPGRDPQPIEKKVEKTLPLTIHYIYENGRTAADDYEGTYKAGESYEVKSPKITGYTADQEVISGVLTEPAEFTVVYTKNTYRLTVNYVYADGSTAAPSYTGKYVFGKNYSITSPVLAGYTASQTVVAGKMPGRNVQVTVVYTTVPAVTAAGSGSGTGLGSGGVNAGDCFE